MADTNDNQQQFQDALSQLFGRLQDPNQAPSLAQSLPPVGTRGMPAGAPVAPAVPPIKPATPSDDPAVTMPTLPTVPSFRAPDALNNRLATRTAIDQVTQAHANDARDNKPHWTDRLMGGALGALVGGVTGNAKQGAEVGGGVTHRAFNRADQQRQSELAPLFNHLNAQKEDEPFYKNADESSQRTFEDTRQNAVEQRNQITSQEKSEVAKQLADIKDTVASNNHEIALDKIKDLQARLDEKKTHDKDWLEIQKELLNLRHEALDLKEKQGAAGKGKTSNKFDTIQKDKAAAEARADREYNAEMAGISDKKSPEALTAAANKTEKYRAAQANYEQRIETQGGDPEHIEYDENGVARDNSGNPVGPARGGGAPAASPGQAAPAEAAPAITDNVLTKPTKPGTKLTDAKIAKQYLSAAAGDKAKARAMAQKDGWKF